jgi:hypothetical protein
MGIALLFVGLLMVIVGARGTYAQFGSQIASEFRGQNNFTYWLLAILAVGALGYIEPIQRISRLLMTLVLLALFLSHKGFFAQFQAALKAGPTQPQAPGQVASTAGGPTNPSVSLPSSSGGFSVPSWVSNAWNGMINGPGSNPF